MYKLFQTPKDTSPSSVQKTDGWTIPFDPANSDYQQFKKDLTDGVELQDSTGTAMTADQIKTFLGTLK